MEDLEVLCELCHKKHHAKDKVLKQTEKQLIKNRKKREVKKDNSNKKKKKPLSVPWWAKKPPNKFLVKNQRLS